ncbi:MAG: hypothetical protein GYA17_02915 [Chloroflexi bacterium]|jgi:F0F1-type ATP synthase membrane subunit a|nr:hypothetical protein [Anaerolineaceae bacterium]NMB87282.1 hypothetical protein [Chloroflexota bacterium]
MGKYGRISVVLSLAVIVLLGVHYFLSNQLGNPDWLDMVVGLPIGMATAFNIDIVISKVRHKK